MTLYATRFELVVVDSYVVRLGDGDFGLYGRRYRNRFGTPLMARGTEAELAALKA
jgi:hypothetical protein